MDRRQCNSGRGKLYLDRADFQCPAVLLNSGFRLSSNGFCLLVTFPKRTKVSEVALNRKWYKEMKSGIVKCIIPRNFSWFRPTHCPPTAGRNDFERNWKNEGDLAANRRVYRVESFWSAFVRKRQRFTRANSLLFPLYEGLRYSVQLASVGAEMPGPWPGFHPLCLHGDRSAWPQSSKTTQQPRSRLDERGEWC